jgi:hypothetical protein
MWNRPAHRRQHHQPRAEKRALQPRVRGNQRQGQRVAPQRRPTCPRRVYLRRRGCGNRWNSPVDGEHGASIRWPFDSPTVSAPRARARATYLSDSSEESGSTIMASQVAYWYVPVP